MALSEAAPCAADRRHHPVAVGGKEHRLLPLVDAGRHPVDGRDEGHRPWLMRSTNDSRFLFQTVFYHHGQCLRGNPTGSVHPRRTHWMNCNRKGHCLDASAVVEGQGERTRHNLLSHPSVLLSIDSALIVTSKMSVLCHGP